MPAFGRLLSYLVVAAALVSLLSGAACRTVLPTPTVTPEPSPGSSAAPSGIPPTPDTSPPYLAASVPAAGSIDIDPAAGLRFVLEDDGSGVDTSSISVKVAGREVRPAISTGSSTAITFRPETPFGYRQKVEVEINAADLAANPNHARLVLSFTTAPRPKDYPPLLDGRGNLRLIMVYYGKHSPDTDSLIINMSPQYIIGNTAHGLWGEAYGYGTPWLLQDVARYHASGVRVIGYLTSGYQGKGSGSGIEQKWYTLETNRKLIENMAKTDKVHGVFIDECDAFPDAAGKKYLKELTDLVHSYGLLAWGNVGFADFDDWFFTEGGFDMMNAQEEWQAHSLTPVQTDWGDRLSVTGLQSGISAKVAYELTVDAWEKGIAYAYIGEAGYSKLPSWLGEYKLLLRNYVASGAAGTARG